MALPTYIETHRTDVERIWCYLVTVELPETPTYYYLTDFDRDVTYGGETYTASPGVNVTGVRGNDSTLAGASLEILNDASNTWGSIASDFAGQNRAPIVTIREAWLNLTANPVTVEDTENAAYVVCKGYAEGPEWNDTTIRFSVANGRLALARKLPARQYGTSCTYRQFKGAQCGYVGAQTTCTRQYADCPNSSDPGANVLRFGGWMALPQVDGKYYYFGGEKLDLGRL